MQNLYSLYIPPDSIDSNTDHAISIQSAGSADIDKIINLRSSTKPGELKPLSDNEIANQVQEFYLAVINKVSVGCMRIFTS